MNAARKTINSTLPNSDPWKEKTPKEIERVEMPPMLRPIPRTSRTAPSRIT